MRNSFVFFMLFLLSNNILSTETIRFKAGNNHFINLPLEIVTVDANKRLINDSSTDFTYKFSSSVRNSNSLKHYMTTVKNQGRRGTCNVFATIGLIEYFEGGNLSEQCLAALSSNQDSGLPINRIDWAIKHGLFYEKDCRYDATQNGRDNIPDLSRKNKIWPRNIYTSKKASIEDPIQHIKGKIDSNSPVIVSIFVAGHDWQKPTIIKAPTRKEIKETCQQKDSNSIHKKCGAHAIVITGYNDDQKYLEFKNSWGKHWPTNDEKSDGYGKMSYSYYLKMRKSDLISRK